MWAFRCCCFNCRTCRCTRDILVFQQHTWLYSLTVRLLQCQRSNWWTRWEGQHHLLTTAPCSTFFLKWKFEVKNVFDAGIRVRMLIILVLCIFRSWNGFLLVKFKLCLSIYSIVCMHVSSHAHRTCRSVGYWLLSREARWQIKGEGHPAIQTSGIKTSKNEVTAIFFGCWCKQASLRLVRVATVTLHWLLKHFSQPRSRQWVWKVRLIEL